MGPAWSGGPSDPWASSDSTSNSQPSSYGEEQMVSGAAAAASLTALTTPVSGEWTSSAVLVDSGSPQPPT